MSSVIAVKPGESSWGSVAVKKEGEDARLDLLPLGIIKMVFEYLSVRDDRTLRTASSCFCKLYPDKGYVSFRFLGNKKIWKDENRSFVERYGQIKAIYSLIIDTAPYFQLDHLMAFKTHPVKKIHFHRDISRPHSRVFGMSEGIGILAVFPVTELAFHHTDEIDDEALNTLSKFPTLTNLALLETSVTNAGMQYLETMPLERLAIRSSPPKRGHPHHMRRLPINQDCFSSLRKMPSLKYLRICNSGLYSTVDKLDGLIGAPCLEELVISDSLSAEEILALKTLKDKMATLKCIKVVQTLRSLAEEILALKTLKDKIATLKCIEVVQTLGFLSEDHSLQFKTSQFKITEICDSMIQATISSKYPVL